jgi:hypothetical protein
MQAGNNNGIIGEKNACNITFQNACNITKVLMKPQKFQETI